MYSHLSWSKFSPFMVEVLTFSAQKTDKYRWFETQLSSNISSILSSLLSRENLALKTTQNTKNYQFNR